jgi:hypothetical protein
VLAAQPNELITKDAQKAIDAALKYLAKEQAEVGSWGARQYKGSVALTSLWGLAFLASVLLLVNWLLSCFDSWAEFILQTVT